METIQRHNYSLCVGKRLLRLGYDLGGIVFLEDLLMVHPNVLEPLALIHGRLGGTRRLLPSLPLVTVTVHVLVQLSEITKVGRVLSVPSGYRSNVDGSPTAGATPVHVLWVGLVVLNQRWCTRQHREWFVPLP